MPDGKSGLRGTTNKRLLVDTPTQVTMKALKYLSFFGKIAGLVSALNIIPFVDPKAGVIVFAAASPRVILEVLSPNTRRIDEVQKLHKYITIPTLGNYILAETEAPFLTLHRRDGAGFRRETISRAEVMLDLPEAGITLRLAEFCRDAG